MMIQLSRVKFLVASLHWIEANVAQLPRYVADFKLTVKDAPPATCARSFPLSE